MLTILTPIIQEITLVAVGILTVIFGIYVWVEHRKSNKFKEREKEERERKEQVNQGHELMMIRFKQELLSEVKSLVKSELHNYVTKKEFEEYKRLINDELRKIHDRFDAAHTELIQLQKASLRTEINDFVKDVHLGIPKTRDAYRYIAHLYDKYKRLGGNNYIDDIWAEAKEILKERWKGENNE